MGNTTQLLLLTANADQHVRMYSLDTTSTEHQTVSECMMSELTFCDDCNHENWICKLFI